LGVLLHTFANARRRVAETNLRLCLPELGAGERAQLVRLTVRHLSQSVVDRALLWHSSAARLRRLITLNGAEHLLALDGKPAILLAPHFIGMDAGWTRLTLERKMAGTYARQTNPVFDAALYRGRTRFNGALALARQDGVRAPLRELSSGLPLYYLPDMDFGALGAVFAPFFGVPAATVTAVSRMARMSGARVLPVVTRMTPQGYVVTIQPPWEHFPGVSDEADARHMNTFIEAEVRANPGQYHWLHKRFKTRPPGELSVY
jgi:Kdo2-lipid IVA lauroyltransferase/acyltransferase